jgi:hypothetical protein
MYCNDQTPKEQSACRKEVTVAIVALALLWGISILFTPQPPSSNDIVAEVFSQTSLTDEQHQLMLTGINEILYNDLSLLNKPNAFRQTVKLLVSRIE